MDYTKTTSFIAFVNKDGKDRFWINGNVIHDREEPRIYAYETKEEKKTAIELGQRLGVWDDTGDIEAVILKVSGKPFHIIDKKEAKELEIQMAEESKERERLRRISEIKTKAGIVEKPSEVSPPATEIKKERKVKTTKENICLS